jgi:hypothetical protein
VILRQNDPFEDRAFGQHDDQRGLGEARPIALVAFQQPQARAGRQIDGHPRGMGPGASRHQPQHGQGFLAGRHIDARFAAVDQHMMIVRQPVERSLADVALEPLRWRGQNADQPAQVGPAPGLVPLAGELGDVARPEGGGEAQAALA